MKPNVEWTNATSYVPAPGYLALSLSLSLSLLLLLLLQEREGMAKLATGQLDEEGWGLPANSGDK